MPTSKLHAPLGASTSMSSLCPPPAIYTAGVPILGICYGEQAMAQQLGGMA